MTGSSEMKWIGDIRHENAAREKDNWSDQDMDQEDFYLLEDLVPDAGLIDDGPTLSESVKGLTEVVTELKNQLKHSVEIKSSLESDLQQAELRINSASKQRSELLEEISRLEKENESLTDMRAEVTQLTRERDTLADKVHDLGRLLATSERRVLETGQLLDRFRAERNDASAEAECLDSQFSRAVKVIEELRRMLTEHQARERVLEEKLKKTANERDAFKLALEESRKALEEVRMSIIEASRSSE